MLPLIVATLLPGAAAVPWTATTTDLAAAAAYADAVALPPKDRPYIRYLWWDEYWDTAIPRHSMRRYELLTDSIWAMISQAGSFPRSVTVRPRLVRIDLRKSGHEKFLAIWENFRGIDPVFHNKVKYFKEKTYTAYFPAGFYATTKTQGEKKTVEKTWYEATVIEEKLNPGDIHDEVAVWANPLVE